MRGAGATLRVLADALETSLTIVSPVDRSLAVAKVLGLLECHKHSLVMILEDCLNVVTDSPYPSNPDVS